MIDRRRTRPTVLALALAAAVAGTASAPLLADVGSKHDAAGIASAERQPYYVRYTGETVGPAPMGVANPAEFAVELQVSSLGGEITHRLPDHRVVAVMLPAQAVAALQNTQGVELVEPVPEMRISGQVVPWNIDQFQARDIWDRDRDGQVDPGAPDGSGVKVCVIDTGFYAPHSDFQGMTVSGMSQISGELWSQDGNGHGTHVAGTINAMNNDIGVVGVMPGGAELYIIKIFNNNGVWVGGQSNLGAAATACRTAGANVISMSLGGGGSTVERDIFADLYNNHGILNVAAAGNDGNSVASYPASYPSVVSVAAIDQSERAAGFTQFPTTSMNPANPPADGTWDVVELAGGGVDVLSTWPGPPHAGIPVYRVDASGTEYGANHIEGAGLGVVTAELVAGGLCTTGSGNASWNGKIVLCERGQVAFAEKINEVRARGGLATVLYNNEAGNFNGTCNNACTTPLIPAVSIAQAHGQALLANHIGSSITVTAQLGSCNGCMGGYNAISGTSMATPGVAAGMGFIWDACGGPTAVSNKDLRLLLRDSAKDLVGQQPSPGNQAYGAGWDRVTGWGLVQLRDAMELGNARFGSTCAIGIGVTPREVEVCGASQDSAAFTLTLGEVFQGTANLSASGLPSGTTGAFSVNPVVHPVKESVYTLSGLSSLADGMYALDLHAVDAGDADNAATAGVTVSLFANAPATVALASPVNGATDVATRPTLSWTGASNVASYTVEIATDAGFTNIVATQTVTGTSFTPATSLAASTTHYWRVRAANVCGNGGWSAPRSFTTATQFCTAPALAIPDNNATGVNSTIVVPPSGEIVDLDVSFDLTHTWVGDMIITLRRNGTNVELINRPRRAGTTSSCNGRNANIVLDDQADLPANTNCVAGDPAYPVGGRFRPVHSLSAFDGTSIEGTWTLHLADRASGDVGTLNGWCLLPTLSAGTGNSAPVVVDHAHAIAHDAVLDVPAPGVLGGATDADGDALTASAVGLPTHGQLSLAANGGFSYTPNAGICGSDGASIADSFTFRANDGQADSNTGTVTIQIGCPLPNRSPVASDDSYATGRNTALSIPAPGVLGNDSDADGDALTAHVVDAPDSGTLVLSTDGSVVYTPDFDACGSDSFTYRANDGQADSNLATVSIDVACSNRSPVAHKSIDDSYTLRALRSVDIDAGPSFSDPDGDALTYSMTAAPASLSIDPATGRITGVLALGDAGSHEITVTATDPDGASAEIEFTLIVTEFVPQVFHGGFEND